MTSLLTTLTRGLTRLLEWLVILIVAVLALDILWGVCSRYLLGNQSTWTEPLATTLLVWVSLLGGALAYGDRSHLGVDYFVNLLHADARRLSRVMVQLLVIGFSLFVMIYGGWSLVAERLASGQVVQGLFGLPRGYVYLSVPISGVFVALYGTAQLFQVLNGKQRPHRQDGEDA